MSAAGIFDIRVWVEGNDEQHVYDLIEQLLETTRDVAPPTVQVRWWRLRDQDRARDFKATMGRPPRSKRTSPPEHAAPEQVV